MSITQKADLAAPAVPRADLLRVAAYVTAALLLVAALLIVFYAPADAVQGVVQKVLYLHVPAAIAAYLCFAIVLGGGLIYLWNESARADRLAHVAAEVGLVFTTVALVMGSIWGRTTWGTYWEPSDPRLVSTLVLWMVYAGYLLVRRIAAPGRQASRFAAIVGIVGFIDVPIVHFSVTWWRSIHPPVESASPGALPPAMLVTLAVSFVAVLLLALVLIGYRYRIESAREARAEAAER